MNLLVLLLISVAVGVGFYLLGRLIGYWIGKRQKMQDEVLKNGSKHR